MKKLITILAFIVAIGTAGFWFFKDMIMYSFQNAPNEEDLTNKDFQIIAHRGASGHAPENTLAAFNKGIEMGADMVELDVHLSADGEVVVFHDETLDRTTNGSGMVKEKTLAELKKLDAGSWFGKDFADEKIPTLGEALRLIDGRAIALIEIKNDGENLYKGIVQKVLDEIDEQDAANWSIVQSFDQPYLTEALKLRADLPYHQLIYLDFKPKSGGDQPNWSNLDPTGKFKAINPYYKTVTAEKVELLHKSGYKIYTYTVNKEEDLRKIISTKVDGIITDYPDRLMKIKRAIQ